jgi:outer membrane protein assembly factor BamB
MKNRRMSLVRFLLLPASTPGGWLEAIADGAERREYRGHGGPWFVVAAGVAGLALCGWGTPTGMPTMAAELGRDRILAESGFRGGLMVQVGCHEADRLLSMAEAPNVLVHVLVRDRDRLQGVRKQICDAELYGRVSAVPWDGPLLPYSDGTVNLLLATETDVGLDPSEIERVLAPRGTAWTLRDGTGTPFRKAWPDDIDQWTHPRYDATGNAVSWDQRVGPPRYLKWEAPPRWNRGVKTSGLVTTKGRLFYILDDSHFADQSPSWSLIARDAFNGIQLWRHELPSWRGARGGKKVGPAQVNRRLVASEDHVFVALGEFAPVSMLDAATGQVVRTFEHTGPAEEFLLSSGTLVVLVNPNTPTDLRRGVGQEMRLIALDPERGKPLWVHADDMILPLTLAADGNQAVYHDGQVIKSLDLKTGAERWRSAPTGQKVVVRNEADPDTPGAEESTILLAPQFGPTLIIYGHVIAFAGGRQLNVVSAADGSELWRSDYAPSNYSVPVDLFGFGGGLWGPDIQMNLWRPLDDNLDVHSYDPQTGAVTKRVTGKYGFRFQHHRCHQMKVVGETILAGRAGIEFLDTDTGEVAAHHWARGSCYFGVLPANGRLYVPPHDCACYVRAKLSGFLSLGSNPPLRSLGIDEQPRLQLGPAYGKVSASNQGPSAERFDWPTYRHDAARSGRSPAHVSEKLRVSWRQHVGGRLTSPVIADGRVFLASTDLHTVYALAPATGQPLWQVTVDGRVDSPPTIHGGLALFGCRDGSVYALRADDGALVWRFVAAPEQRLIVSHGQLESVWPIPGSVLVVNNIAYFAAGRSSYLDGGIHLYGLDPHTGHKLVDVSLSTRHADGSQRLDEQGVDGNLNDVLSSNGQSLFMRHQMMDLQGNRKNERVSHLHSPDGFLSPDTTNRLLWTYAPMYTSPHQGAFYDLRLSRMLFPSGRILVEDDETIYGYGQNRFDRPLAQPGGQWALFAAAKQNGVPLELSAVEYRRLATSGKRSVKFHWWKKLPINVRAMVKAKDVLFVAGPQGTPLTSRAALRGQAPAWLLAFSPTDGGLLARIPLPSPPVWDGMATAQGGLCISLANGHILYLSASAPD